MVLLICMHRVAELGINLAIADIVLLYDSDSTCTTEEKVIERAYNYVSILFFFFF
ncbi:unnamed protein product [Prunus armeniaca]|uniref:Uncharacterized protein n=1 Tax=Prunus armeniaca TaxID=36596 RepID=A0A6J5TWZ5_PRUAR|nr:unnamed protein product [Prunus armeniaca]CAB4294294.1 unnamed protein product [Prunus armeniaca]